MKLFSQRFIPLFNEAAGGDASGGGGGGAQAPATTVVDPAPSSASAPAAPAGFVNADGTFVQGWHQQEQFKDSPGLDRWKDFPSFVKSYKALESKLGTSASSAPAGPPPADAPPEVVAAYREAIGVPATPEAYQLKPETIPEHGAWSDDAGKHFSSLFHKHNIPAGVAKDLAAEYVKFEADQVRIATTAFENTQKANEAKLRSEWGGNYDTKVSEVRGLVAQLGYDPNDLSIFNNPTIVGFLGKVVGQLSADSVATLRGTVAAGGQLRSGPDEARAIMTDPNHPDYARYYGGDQEVMKKVSRLAGSGAV